MGTRDEIQSISRRERDDHPSTSEERLTMNRLTIPIANGADPEIIEHDDIGDCDLAVGADLDLDDFGEIVVFCESPNAPGGTCEYNAAALDPTLCKHCGKRTG